MLPGYAEPRRARPASAGQPAEHVFTRGDGSVVCDFRKTCRNACIAAGCPNLLFHDLRRTGARNLLRAGIPETVIMQIGGRRTRSVFERYAIVNRKEMAAPYASSSSTRRRWPSPAMVTVLVTVAKFCNPNRFQRNCSEVANHNCIS